MSKGAPKKKGKKAKSKKLNSLHKNRIPLSFDDTVKGLLNTKPAAKKKAD